MGRGGARPGAGRPRGLEKTTPLRVPESMLDSVVTFVAAKGYKLPLYSSLVSAGLLSPADDHKENMLDLNELVVTHPTATFLVRASGESMINAGIQTGDILVVDNSVEPSSGKIVIAAVDGQLTVKRLEKTKTGKVYLMPENSNFSPIALKPENDVIIWGVVTHVIHSV